ncbi:MAG: hypothetical protein CMP48_05010 [Rickettsiales bacterium]|nr:hypothetical protein [Rickettsiales bacterium]
MTNQEFVALALSFQGVIENPHFDRRAFKVEKKRIFTTLHESTRTANVKLSLSEQQIFCENGDSIYPVPNKWGEQGWTTLDIQSLD